jgi:endonuclease G
VRNVLLRRRHSTYARACNLAGGGRIVTPDEQQAAAAARVLARTAERDEKIQILSQPGGIAKADDPARIAKRMDRLARYHCGDDVPSVTADVSDEDARALFTAAAQRVAQSPLVPAIAPGTADRPDVVLEKIINNSDFLEVRYLDAGQLAGRAVGRITIRDERERNRGYGTGSLVSPRLLLTNHHVLADAATAARSVVEFNYQDDVNRKPLPTQQFGFDPDTFFVTDKERDFTLVAVRATEEQLAEFGFNPLISAEGKAIVGEYVTIVQHPGGEKKQLVLRDQQIVDVPADFLHYMADTAPGSSGSPVFNDQWEIVALHHASVRAPEVAAATGGFVNEGVRISRILRAVADRSLPDAQKALVDALVVHSAAPPPHPTPEPPESPRMSDPTPPPVTVTTDAVPTQTTADGWLQITVPLEIRLRLGAPTAAGVAVAPASIAAPPQPSAPGVATAGLETVVIDPDFASRRGFDTAFLGGGHEVALPQLSPAQQALASVDATATGDARHVLRYHHYSVVMNRERRLAFWVGVNIDGALHTWRKELTRTKDKWFLDPRIPESEQVGEEMYTKNALDRGHLVRRLDPAWGPDLETAKKANDDTFHFTNCTPQHEDFNQNKTTWAGLEDYILDNAGKGGFKVSVFTGPVLADDDDLYRGVKLPRQFWKVAAIVKGDGTLSATAYLLSQEQLIENLEVAEEFSYGAYKTFQVPVKQVEDLTGLSFGELSQFDPLERLEATLGLHEITSPESLIL